MVRTGSCFSACALILAGGVIRVGPTWFDDPVIGVHRIYFAELESGLSSSEVKSRYDAQLARVRKYLAQMNVAPEFLSFMQAVGPENSHVMTHEELTRYGLGPKDVVYDERMTADRAAEFGINSLEYRRRERRGTEECKGISSGMPEPTDAELLEARRSHVSIDILRQAQCSLAIHYGISVSLYLERSAQVTARCSRYTEKTQQNRCHAHFMTSGKAIP